MAENKQVPVPVQLALEALEILTVEDAALAEESRKKLPGFALRLAQAGEEVTVEGLLASARVREIERVVEQKQKEKTYEEIVAAFPQVAAVRIEAPHVPIGPNFFRAAKEGNLEEIKRVVAQGYSAENFVRHMSRAAEHGHLHIVKYLTEKFGPGIHNLDEERWTAIACAAREGYLDIVKYIAEACGVNLGQGHYTSAMRLAGLGDHVDVVKYLIEECGADLHGWGNDLLAHAVEFCHIDLVKYLVEERGIDASVMLGTVRKDALLYRPEAVKYLVDRGAPLTALPNPEQIEKMEEYFAACDAWQKIMRREPPEHLYEKDPAYFRPKTYDSVCDMFREEQKTSNGLSAFHHMAFDASSLFSTEDRVLQYLEKWGKAGKQPLHDILYMARLPEKKTPEMDLKAWGDAVLKCGPSMAKLLKFADRLPAPEKSDDGNTWSMRKTRETVAQFTYSRANENPALAILCFEKNIDEKTFNRALELSKKSPAVKNIPDITIDGAQFGLPEMQFHRLAANDVRGLFLGELTDCCQSIGGAGAKCAEHGFTSEDGGFYVVENAHGQVVGQTWAWRGKKGELVFDSLETLGDNVRPEQWIKLAQAFKHALAKKPGDVTALHIGKGGATPNSLIDAFTIAAAPAKPIAYDGYRDSHKQVVVWQKKAGGLNG